MVRAFLASQADLPFTYDAVGASLGQVPEGFVLDHHRVALGRGVETFATARAAISRWAMFDIGWVTLCWPEAPIEVGSVVGILARCSGIWSLNACRIVAVVDDHVNRVERFGFAYGTLPGHVESGEERFMVEWDRATDTVWYDLLAFSRPNHPVARWGRPLARRMQRRFAADSLAAMTRASAPGEPAATGA